jgi:hypothetical protein
MKKLGASFKYNPRWSVEENFCDLVKSSWTSFDQSSGLSPSEQFIKSLRVVKEKVSSWASKRFHD